MIGETLSHYRIIEKIGAGGMGEVYKAHDERLDRDVAVKVLPSGTLADEQARKRFRKEAQALSKLNHPNIATVHDFDTQEGVDFIVMEYVEGAALAEKVRTGPLPEREVTSLGTQIAEALEEAHERGVVHRDLKPGNIAVTPKGRVKVLDFGLARMLRPVGDEATTEALTEELAVVGTLPYMSPEELRGERADHRSDLYSFGVVLYVMATGRRPFEHSLSTALADAIIHKPPEPPTSHNRKVSPGLERIILKALDKDPEHRYQTANEIRNELEELKREVESGAASDGMAIVPPSLRRKLALLAAFMVVAVLAVIATYFFIRQIGEDTRARPVSVTQLTFESSQEMLPSLSPDGQFFVFAGNANGNWDIYLQRVGGRNAINLTKDSQANDTQPAFSPDGENIAFRSDRDGGGIFVMGTTGESLTRLTASGYDPSWSSDGTAIVYTSNQGSHGHGDTSQVSQLLRVEANGGDPALIAEGQFFQPRWSPNGHRIVYYSYSMPSGLNQADIWTLPAEGGDPVPVTKDSHVDWSPAWSPDGHYIYFTSNRAGSYNIWRIRVDEETGSALSGPEPVTSGTGAEACHLSASADGRYIVYTARISTMNLQRVAFDPVAEEVVGEPVWVTTSGGCEPNVSPSGEWLAFTEERFTGGSSSAVLNIMRTDGTGLRQLTDSPHRDRWSRWSPDGKRIAFRSNRSGSYEIWSVNRDGSDLRQLTDIGRESSTVALIAVWSPDGSRIACTSREAFCIFDADKPWSEKPPELPPPFDEEGEYQWFVDSWSPDGKQLAGVHFKGDEYGISLYSLDTRSYRRVRDFGGSRLIWLSDNRRLLFRSSQLRDPHIYSVLDVTNGEHHEVLSSEILGLVPTESIARTIGLSSDDRNIYFTRLRDEADIWLLTLNVEREERRGD